MAPRAVSIVLSGTGLDGSSGLKRVKEHGGIIMAQEPRESDHDDMPRNAIATGLVDHILPVGEMPCRLVALARQFGPVRGAGSPRLASAASTRCPRS